jgi:hypothetical protein
MGNHVSANECDSELIIFVSRGITVFPLEVQEYEMLWCGVGKTPYCTVLTNCSELSDSVYGQKV